MKKNYCLLILILIQIAFAQQKDPAEKLQDHLSRWKPISLQQVNQLIFDNSLPGFSTQVRTISNINTAFIEQIGDKNTAYILQAGINNSVRVHQTGTANKAELKFFGTGNMSEVLQEGDYNDYSLEQMGDEAEFSVEQSGFNNILHQKFSGDKLKFIISQSGSNNEILQLENSESTRGYSIFQKGTGMKLYIINGSVNR